MTDARGSRPIDPVLGRWYLQPLVNAGLTNAELENFAYRLNFEAIIKGGEGSIDGLLALADDQTPRVKKAWKVSVWRMTRILSGEVTADNIPDLTLEEWLLAQIVVDERAARLVAEAGLPTPVEAVWPADRVLVECENKRQLTEHVVAAVKVADDDMKDRLLDQMRLLAQPYADREGFQEEWRL